MSISSLNKLEKLIDYSVERQKVISNNIANVATQGYKREDVSFENFLSDAIDSEIKTTDARHIKVSGTEETNMGEFTINEDQSKDNISGVNNVDINKEMAQLAENTILFKFASRKINSYFRNLQSVIRGGR